jgi:hypothetical protein
LGPGKRAAYLEIDSSSPFSYNFDYN